MRATARLADFSENFGRDPFLETLCLFLGTTENEGVQAGFVDVIGRLRMATYWRT